MRRSSVALIPLVALAVSVSCSSEDRYRPPTTGDLPSSGVTTSGGQGSGTGGQGGAGGQGGGTGGQGGAGGQGGSDMPSCSNGAKDSNETDIDCGGACATPCRVDQACAEAADCFSGRCEESGGSGGAERACVAAQCDNGVKDGDETDTDCGGGAAPRGGNPACPPCKTSKGCAAGSDCESMSCVNGQCLEPTCSDAVKNGQETDVDCGGICPGCPPGDACSKSTDCIELVCHEQVCQDATCSDGVKNGKETDIDCGGTDGCNTRCPAGQRCNANTDCATSICNTTNHVCACPAWMVISPVSGGGSYCIDQYEVTKQEYDVFLMANPVLAGMPAECAGNIYRPSSGWPFTEGRVPVTYVDWCDAYAYCSYMGKHLCGRIGGGANSPADFATPTRSEWFNACSGQGVNEYPYSDLYSEATCKVEDPTGELAKKPVPPNPIPPISPCEGGITGLFHMSGNVAEWENSCDAQGNCLVRGGSRASQQDADDIARDALKAARCDALLDQDRLTPSPDIGFRCCL